MDRADTAAAEFSFPTDFLWGAATAAHQIEGGNVNNDSWAKEHDPDSGYAESSGDACDSLHRWPEDIELIAAMGLGAYRFSLEWSRIEPAEGEFSNAALDYYRRICAACRERDIVPVVTFHHFTNPTWLTGHGGWEAADAPDIFSRFVTRAGAHLGDLIGWACTINELNLIGVRVYDLWILRTRGGGQLCPPHGDKRGHGASTPSGCRRLAVGTRHLSCRPDVVHGRDGGRSGWGDRSRSGL